MHHFDLSMMVGQMVRINRAGPESRTGLLLAAKPDYVMIHTEEDGHLYYKTNQIKSISIDTKIESENHDLVAEYLVEEDFQSVLYSLKHHWVQINSGGPEKLEGIISEVHDDWLTLINNNEVVMVFNYHIKNISWIGNKNSDEDGIEE